MLRRHFFLIPVSFVLAGCNIYRLEASEETPKDASVDPRKIVFLADLHIGPDVPKHAENLKKIVTKIVSMNPRPSKIFILGDLVSTYGKTEEYEELKTLFAPIDAAGIPWFIVVGNHDSREPMFRVFPDKKMEIPENPGKQIGIVESQDVDFIILDSRMDDTKAYMAEKEKYPNRCPWDGTMDVESIARLETILSNRQKPVFILAHHPIQQTKLAPILAKYPCVQGYLFGHNHQFLREKNVDGIETFAFPTTSERILTPTEPNGYMVMQTSESKYDFTLVSLNESHPLNGRRETLP